MLNPKDVSAYNSACLNCTRHDCPGMCRELKESLGIVKSKSVTLEYNGVRRSVAEWSEIMGIPRTTIYDRMNRGLSPDQVLTPYEGVYHSTQPRTYVEAVYTHISSMHLDYKLFWDRENRLPDSAGMTTNYHKIMVSPTNKITRLVEQQAMPGIMESDYSEEKKAWIAFILDMIKKYRDAGTGDRHFPNSLKANILEWRAIDGWTMPKISEHISSFSYRPVTIHSVRSYLSRIVDELIPEALARGLLESQK